MRDIIDATAKRLQAAGLEEARLKAELLIAHVAGVPRLELMLRDVNPSSPELDLIVGRAIRGEPIQYVLGSAEFFGHTFKIDRRVLIPRPETEELVEWVLFRARSMTAPTRVTDVGTGSGCIAIAIALALPNADVSATDISGDALALARENACALGARVDFRQADLLDGVADGCLDVVVSNPPYVSESEWATLPRDVRDHEPRLALVVGADGFAVIARLVDQAFRALRKGGMLFMEIGETQAARTGEIMETVGFGHIEVRKDMAGHQRMIAGARP